MLLMLFCLGILLSLLCVQIYQTKSHTAKLLNAFPTCWKFPILGQIMAFDSQTDKLFIQSRRIFGSNRQTIGMWAFFYPTLHIVSADDVEIILSSTKHIDKGGIYSFIKPWLSDGLLVSTGEKWQHRRKILTPSFHFNILRRFVQVFGDYNRILTQKLEEESNKPKTNIIPILNHLTLGNICETAMGTKINEKNQEQKSYFNSVYKIEEIITKRCLTPTLYNDLVFKYSPQGRTFQHLLRTLHSFTKNVIKERKLGFKKEDVDNLENNEDFGGPKKRLAMLDLLISANQENEIDDDGIQEEVDTFMFEGHDTTSVSIRYILLTLANHQDIQEKVIAELDEIFGTSKRESNYDDLQQMKYTEMCIKECLRLYPSVYFISRYLTEDTPLTHHIAPAGTEVCIHIYEVHRDARYFPEPEKFDPDRFLPENSRGRNPYAYIPFSAGPRNCIGQRFAMLELKSIVAAVLRNFRMKPIDSAADLTWISGIVLRTRGPIYIKFEKREF